MFEENIRSYIIQEVLGRLTGVTLPDAHVMLGSGVILDTVIRTLINILAVSSFFRDYADTLVHVGEIVIKESVRGMEKENPEIRSLSGLCFKSFIEALCRLVVRIQESKATQSLIIMFSQEKGILPLLSHILLSPVTAHPVLIFYPQPKDTAEESVNHAKAEILEMLKSVVSHLFIKTAHQTKVSSLSYFETLSSIVARSVEQVQTVCTLSKVLISKMGESSKRVMLACLNLISKTSSLNDFFSIYSPAARGLITHVLLPEIQITEREIEDFDFNEVEFVNFSMDVCFSRNSKVAKTFAMEIIGNLCDKIDGILTFTAVGVMALIDAVLAQKSKEDLLKEFPAVESFIMSDFVKDNSPDKVLDVCLLVLTSLHPLVTVRQDLM